MDEQRRKDAIEYIDAQLKDGYIDLGLHDQDELEIIKEAMDMLKTIDKINSIPIGFIIPPAISTDYYSTRNFKINFER